MNKLVTIEPENSADDIVETLEKALATAENGGVSSVLVAFVYRDGTVGHRRSNLPSTVLMLGSLARAAHKLNLSLDPTTYTPEDPAS